MNKLFSLKLLTLAFIMLILMPTRLEAQKSTLCASFKSVSRPERCWALTHIFIAKKAFLISKDCRQTTEHYIKKDSLDGDIQGGQVDAFKHAYWMARLTQEIKWKKAEKLGFAHEKGNYLTFKKGIKKGKTNFPDKASSDMDLWNNKQGISIGTANPDINPVELQRLTVEAIYEGKMRIIKKESTGLFLNRQGDVIPTDSLKGKWENEKVLVPSNWKK